MTTGGHTSPQGQFIVLQEEHDDRAIRLECLPVTPMLTFPPPGMPLTRALDELLDHAPDLFCCAPRQPDVWWRVHEKGGDPVTKNPGTREVIVT